MSSSPYLLHLPAASRPGDPAAIERAEVVRDGFSWAACLVPSLWFLRHRNWLPALFSVVAIGGLAAVLWALGSPPGTIVAAEALLHLLFGFEGASLRRLDLAWRGRPASGMVIAGDALEAETESFERWLNVRNEPVPAPITDRYPPRPAPDHVIGLFPDREGRG